MTTQSHTSAEYLDPTNLAARDELHRMGVEFLGLPVFYFEGQVTEQFPPLDDNLLRLVREKLTAIEKMIFTSTLNLVVGNPVARKDDFTDWDFINATPIQQLLAAMHAIRRVR